MDKSTLVKRGEDARKAILRGVNYVYDSVKLTLGPEGGNALMPRTYNRGPRITNDGITIAELHEPKDEFENLAANAFKESAKRTNEKAGDGTTTTIVIAGKLINDVFNLISSPIPTVGGEKIGVMKLKKEIIEAAETVIEKIAEKSTKIESLEDLEKIATVSVEDHELGKIIAGIVWETGLDGFIDVVEGYKGTIETEIIKGMRFPAKVPAKAFVNNPARFEMIGTDVPVIVTNFSLDNAPQVVSFLSKLNEPKIAIFAPSFSESVLISLIASRKQSGFTSFPVAVPSLRTEQFDDLATYTGAAFINKDKGMKLDRIQASDLGWLEKIVVKDVDAKEDAVVTGGKGTKEVEVKVGKDIMIQEAPVAQRIKTLQGQLEETREAIHKKLLERRIASMASAIGVIRVGAPSQAEALYKKLKIEDATYACKAALQEGYVKGGGLCLKEIAEELPETILTAALKAPYEQIQANAEGTLDISEDIIDPAKSTRLAVEHAVSVTAHLATVKIIVAEVRDESPAEGYRAIAQALMMYNRIWNKKEGIMKENELEVERDWSKLYEEKLLADN